MNTSKLNSIAILIISCLLPFIHCSAQTIIPGGAVSGTWALAGSPYLIQGSVNIPNDSTLTIEPGVTVSFQTSSKLTMLVKGRLLAIGTETDTIRFTASDTTNGFNGLRFNNITLNNDTSKITYCRFQYGKSTGAAPNDNGGALFFHGWGKAIVSQSYISNCWAGSSGGAICCDSASNPVISGNTIIGNIAGSGGYGYGGGIACLNNSSPAISNNTIIYNINNNGGPNGIGGGIYCNASSPAIFSNTISYNTSKGPGGGIACDGTGSNASITYNTISYNTALNSNISCNGAGIYCNYAKPTISHNTISYNTGSSFAWGFGGGIFCGNTTSFPAITYNTITYNSNGRGGGISCENATLSGINFNTISNNYVSNNTANDYGGGIDFNFSTISSVSNNSITNNFARLNGGAFYLNQSTITSAINNTIANNKADKGGALFCENNSDPLFRNCILYGNTAITSGGQVFLSDEASDPKFYYSDVQDSLAGFGLNGNTYTGVYSNNINTNPFFVSPSSGSGDSFDGAGANWQLQTTSSPSINKGDPATTTPLTDLAGNTRVTVCRIDQGAYENQYAQPLILTKTTSNTVCGQLCTGSATANVTGGALPITYHWSPGNETTQTISSQCAGTYTVTATDANGCFKTTTAIISANPTMTATFTKTPVSCNGGSDGTATVNVNNGAGPYNFSWSTVPVQTAQTATGLSAVTYTVVVTDNNGCTINPTVTVLQPTAINLNKSKTNASCLDNDGTASVAPSGGIPPYTYMWSTIENTPVITGLSSGTYTITVTDFNNCIASDTIQIAINTLAIPNPIPICMVTVDDQSTHNIIIWEKPIITTIDSFRVYREDVTNVYTYLASVSYDSLSVYHDYGVNPNSTGKRYKITLLDICNGQSTYSPYHNTIWLNYLGSGILSWTSYLIEGQANPVNQYVIYRDDLSTGNFVQIGTTAGTQLGYTDVDYYLYTNARYLVDVAWNISCTPTRATINTTRSNIRNGNISIGIANEEYGTIKIYPNPASDKLTIELNNQTSTTLIKIMNVLGQFMMAEEIAIPASGNKTLKQIDVSSYPRGIYTVCIENNGKKRFMKLVKN